MSVAEGKHIWILVEPVQVLVWVLGVSEASTLSLVVQVAVNNSVMRAWGRGRREGLRS